MTATTEPTERGRETSTDRILSGRPELRRLLLTLAQSGKCAEARDPEAWFSPPPFGHARARQHAAALCEGCAVLAQCRTYSITAGEEYGVWGGLCELDRAQLRESQTARSRDLLNRRELVLPFHRAG